MTIDMSDLIVAIIGGIGALLLERVVVAIESWLAKKRVLKALIDECNYNLKILHEVVKGSTDKRVAFKRMKVMYFRDVDARKDAFGFSEDIRTALSHVIIDLELLNREVECSFEVKKNCGESAISWDKLDEVILAAGKGVEGSLRNLKSKIQIEIGLDADNDE